MSYKVFWTDKVQNGGTFSERVEAAKKAGLPPERKEDLRKILNDLGVKYEVKKSSLNLWGSPVDELDLGIHGKWYIKANASWQINLFYAFQEIKKESIVVEPWGYSADLMDSHGRWEEAGKQIAYLMGLKTIEFPLPEPLVRMPGMPSWVSGFVANYEADHHDEPEDQPKVGVDRLICFQSEALASGRICPDGGESFRLEFPSGKGRRKCNLEVMLHTSQSFRRLRKSFPILEAR